MSTRPLARGPPARWPDFPVVGIGASAGGLEACRRLLDTLPATTGMAFILVQHLDPNHESMMAELLAGHTALTVREATHGLQIEREHLYVIPPGTYLSVSKGTLQLSQPTAHHGARMPVDFLFNSLAQACGPRAVCIVLSGTGADGSIGLGAVKEQQGLVIAQAPDEASYDGMPRSAVLTGLVDLVLPVAKIAEALVRQSRAVVASEPAPHDAESSWLPKIIDLLRRQTAHDFRLYKRGTLQRRIERRMALVSIDAQEMGRYLELLQRDPAELTLLAKDLLINVTSFFRDPGVFELLADKTIPELVGAHPSERPLRIWVAGCSTGEETYSLAMLFLEAIANARGHRKLQVFASDVDPDAIASAREGVYPHSIEAEVSPARLARFFTKEELGYRVLPDLRAAVVFTVQDVLADPPFSRLDMVSCRNLLIYLGSEAQAKVISLFHFALRQGGILLLGNAETAGNIDGRFEVIAKPERIYRHIGGSRSGELGFSLAAADGVRIQARTGQGRSHARQTALSELCRDMVMASFAPAAVLISRKHECLFSLGPTDRYLRVPPGHPTHDLLAMAPAGMRTKLRSAIHQACEENARIVVPGGRVSHDGATVSFNIDVQCVRSEGEELLLVSFIDVLKREHRHAGPVTPANIARVAELELELEATRTELQGAIHNLEISGEEQKAINEEALSVNEEYQSTNEELLTSKEELQSLNEELTALNSQLQETLERQRTTANDLQNVLYSTDVATLFLDTALKIRFFTPATKSLFRVIPGDVGRPLSDLRSLATDKMLAADARAVLQTLAPLEREVETQSGVWFIRRILPYRNHENGVDGVVITFTDITERKHTARALELAMHQAEQANVAKSRFLAAASHDLRQPLQTLALLQGILAKSVSGEKAQKLVARQDETLAAMSGMLNALLDINQIDAGTVHAEIAEVPVSGMFDRLRNEFLYHAQAQGLALHVVPCALSVCSDPRLLEQMIRNLLSNALKYTREGRLLLGCRRHGDHLRIEVWDTGIGIPDAELQAIFDEYHQLDNAARERSRGLGLGLSIVQRLGELLQHRITVRSWVGRGSVFAIEAPLPTAAGLPVPVAEPTEGTAMTKVAARTGSILVIEDDPQLRELLELVLKAEGHRVRTAPDGIAALDMVTLGKIRPDLVLADYNLPNGMDGLQLGVKLRERLQRRAQVIILTGDISTATLRDIADQNFLQLNKPVKLAELTSAVQALLPASQATMHPLDIHIPAPRPANGSPIVVVIDDDRNVREAIQGLLEREGRDVEGYASAEAFLAAFRPERETCLLIDADLPGISGLELLQQLGKRDLRLSAIMITGGGDVSMAVQAMKAGAADFIEKPVGGEALLASIGHALERLQDSAKQHAWRAAAKKQVDTLTPRQREIMRLVLAGQPSKIIASDLGISQRTVENHRAAIMKATGSKSLQALAQLVMAAADGGDDQFAALRETVSAD